MAPTSTHLNKENIMDVVNELDEPVISDSSDDSQDLEDDIAAPAAAVEEVSEEEEGSQCDTEEFEVKLRPTVSRPVCLGVRRPSGTRDQFFFLLEIVFRQLRVCYFVAPSLTRGRVCNLLYNCFWALPEQSLLGRSRSELTAIFYCLI
jgi:hypothetical protein